MFIVLSYNTRVSTSFCFYFSRWLKVIHLMWWHQGRKIRKIIEVQKVNTGIFGIISSTPPKCSSNSTKMFFHLQQNVCPTPPKCLSKSTKMFVRLHQNLSPTPSKLKIVISAPFCLSVPSFCHKIKVIRFQKFPEHRK